MAGSLVARRGYVHGDEMRFDVLRKPLERLRGLLGTGCDARPVALMGCSSIHTFGMRYRLDVAFVSSDGYVLESWRSVPPGRLLSNRKAKIALERPHSCGSWVARGERLSMRLEDERDAG